MVVEVAGTVNVDDVLYRCLGKLSWLEEAWYYWVMADELTWNKYYDRAAKCVEKSLQWLKRIILNRKAEGALREHIEQLVKEIEVIDHVDALNEGQVLGLTSKFRHVFFHHLAECILEEAQQASVFKPPQ
jgi:hypothetical protein